jgi:hypothetical protein
MRREFWDYPPSRKYHRKARYSGSGAGQSVQGGPVLA